MKNNDPVKVQELAHEREEWTSERRKFLKGAGVTGVGLLSATILGSRLGLTDDIPGAKALGLNLPSVAAASLTDADILNFALNLEYLEAEFYTMAVSGKTIEQVGIGVSGTGSYGPTTGGQKITFGGPLAAELQMSAQGLMLTEQYHVRFLRAALGSAAVAKPEINLDALGKISNYNLFIAAARALEQTGESAYAGAAPSISNKAYLLAAAKILIVEAEHTGNIRLFCDVYKVPTMKIDALDILPPPSGTHIYTNDSQGLAVSRTPSQVLAIVYGNSTSGTSRGGFFPKGLNGAINVV